MDITYNQLHEFLKSADCTREEDGNGNLIIRFSDASSAFDFDVLMPIVECDNDGKKAILPTFYFASKNKLPDYFQDLVVRHDASAHAQSGLVTTTFEFFPNHNLRSLHLQNILPHFIIKHYEEIDVTTEPPYLSVTSKMAVQNELYAHLGQDDVRAYFEETIAARIEAIGQTGAQIMPFAGPELKS